MKIEEEKTSEITGVTPVEVYYKDEMEYDLVVPEEVAGQLTVKLREKRTKEI